MNFTGRVRLGGRLQMSNRKAKISPDLERRRIWYAEWSVNEDYS